MSTAITPNNAANLTLLGLETLNPAARLELMRAGEARVRELVTKWQDQTAQGEPDFDGMPSASLRATYAELHGDLVELRVLLPSSTMANSNAWTFGGAAVGGVLDAAAGKWAASLLALTGIAGWIYAPPVLSAAARDVARGVSASLLYLAVRDLVRPCPCVPNEGEAA